MKAEKTFSTLPERRFLFWLFISLLFFGFLYLIRGMLLPFVVGLAVAYFLDPAADRLEKAGLGRTTATAIITLGFFSIVVTACILLVPMLAEQISGLVDNLPKYYDGLRGLAKEYIAKLPKALQNSSRDSLASLNGDMLKSAEEFLLNLLKSGMMLVNLVSLLVITPVVAFYLLRDWDTITAQVDKLLPRRHAITICQQLSEIDRTIAGFVRGQLNVMLILGSVYALGLTASGLNYGAVIGVIAGLLIIIPYAGTFIGATLALGIAFVQFKTIGEILPIAVTFMIGQALEGYYLTPKLVGSKVGLHPVWVIFGMLAGGTLFGFVGILLAVPVTAVIGVLIRFAVSRYLESDLYQ